MSIIRTRPGDDPYRGEPSCGDCCSMTHCETHGKDVGTYPFDDTHGLETWPRVWALAETVLGRVAFPSKVGVLQRMDAERAKSLDAERARAIARYTRRKRAA